MPIRKDLLPLYKTPEYKQARDRVQARAKNCCEQCGKPNGRQVETITGRCPDVIRMYWRTLGPWFNCQGTEVASLVRGPDRLRTIIVVLTLAHLDHNPANNSDDNLKFLCQWCHLNYDKLHHAETRSIRKDRERPLLTNA